MLAFDLALKMNRVSICRDGHAWPSQVGAKSQGEEYVEGIIGLFTWELCLQISSRGVLECQRQAMLTLH